MFNINKAFKPNGFCQSAVKQMFRIIVLVSLFTIEIKLNGQFKNERGAKQK